MFLHDMIHFSSFKLKGKTKTKKTRIAELASLLNSPISKLARNFSKTFFAGTLFFHLLCLAGGVQDAFSLCCIFVLIPTTRKCLLN